MAVKVLNLYAGVGGNRKLWKNVDVVAIVGLVDPPLPFRILGLYWQLRDFSPTTGIDVKKKRTQYVVIKIIE